MEDFKNFFCHNPGPFPFDMTSLGWMSLPDTEANCLSRPFNKEEVLVALKDNDLRKAPGLDGFNTGWLK